MMSYKNFEIISTEIIDNTVKNENENIQPSEISVLVEVEVDGRQYYLDYQTTTTSDYGAYSSRLAAYNGSDSYDDLAGFFEDGTRSDDFHKLLAEIKKESKAQERWKEYVEENYEVDDSYFGGMDGNSEVNRAVKK